jgi:pimeloyl-ACP methyl ester carboxylesterase
MEILYLHGYQGSPNWDRVEWMESLGHKVIAPQIDYDKDDDFFINLLDMDFDFIVGNSLGGFTAFYLSLYKDKPSICINPPLYMNLRVRMNVPIKYKIKGCRSISIIVGNDDEVVDPIKTYGWLTKNKPFIDIKMIDGMGHHFDLETFTKFTHPILNKKVI